MFIASAALFFLCTLCPANKTMSFTSLSCTQNPAPQRTLFCFSRTTSSRQHVVVFNTSGSSLHPTFLDQRAGPHASHASGKKGKGVFLYQLAEAPPGPRSVLGGWKLRSESAQWLENDQCIYCSAVMPLPWTARPWSSIFSCGLFCSPHNLDPSATPKTPAEVFQPLGASGAIPGGVVDMGSWGHVHRVTGSPRLPPRDLPGGGAHFAPGDFEGRAGEPPREPASPLGRTSCAVAVRSRGSRGSREGASFDFTCFSGFLWVQPPSLIPCFHRTSPFFGRCLFCFAFGCISLFGA